MKVLDKGHKYELNQRRGADGLPADGKDTLQFVNREDGRKCDGVTTQEVIRALIDRTYYCNDCLEWSGNQLIVDHLRMALVLHEARAMIRKVEKGQLPIEHILLGEDGHLSLTTGTVASDYCRMRNDGTETGSLNPGVCAHEQAAVKPSLYAISTDVGETVKK